MYVKANPVTNHIFYTLHTYKITFENINMELSKVHEVIPIGVDDLESKATNTLNFNVSFSVGEKQILTDASGELHSGECLAIMGPSGAGKTTLLSVLTLDTRGGRSVGEVTLNGRHMDGQLFKSRCAVVNQEDYHWSALTCRETITYAADLYLGLGPAETKQKVDDMIAATGLESCADTIVGNALVKGLSGGQKRRLSVAVALLKKLDVIYLDEPTSGLDSASASSIMKFITQVTKEHNLISLTTIHQPSTAVYNSFDKVMILSKGRVAYMGNSGPEATKYFSGLGHQISNNMNPAEFMVDLVNADFNDEAVVENILTSWSKTNPPVASNSQVVVAATKELEECTFCRQLVIMLDRHLKLVLRDPLLFVGRMGIFICALLFFAIMYVAARDPAQDQVMNRMWYATWCLGIPSNMAVIAVYTYNSEFFAIKREVQNGMTSPSSYLAAMTIIQIPIMFIFGICAWSVGAYGVLDFNADNYFLMIFVFAVFIFCFEALAQLLSVVNENPLLGMLNLMQMWFASFLFAGIMIPQEDVIWPFRAFGYISPMKYALRTVVYTEFIDRTFDGAELCDPTTDSNCYYSGSNTGADQGWTCGANNEACFGKEGWQVLDQLHRSFDTISSKDEYWISCLFLICFAVVVKIAHFYVATQKANATDTIFPKGSVAEKSKGFF